jgi:hypothetical protein
MDEPLVQLLTAGPAQMEIEKRVYGYISQEQTKLAPQIKGHYSRQLIN